MKFDLVFEGGGAKGLAFVGALQEFETRGHTTGRLLGTSAGAIFAGLLSAGYTSSEMLTAITEKLPDGKSVFSSFLAFPGPFDHTTIQNSAIRAFLRAFDIPFLPEFVEEKLDDAIIQQLADANNFRHLFSFIERGGWFSSDQFLTWLENKLDTGNFAGKPRKFSKLTLQQFFEVTHTHFSVVAADTNARKMLVLNHRTAPSCPLVMAIRMSMSVPLLWQEIIWQKEWGLYLGQALTGDAIVDGGMLSNFPIELFLSNLKDITQVMGESTSQNILGLLIDEDTAVPNAPEPNLLGTSFNITDSIIYQRISRLVDTTLSARDKMVIDDYSDLVVRLPAKNYGTTEFNMSEARQTAIIQAGQTAMKNYLDNIPLQSSSIARFHTDGSPTSTHTNLDQLALKIIK